MKPAACHRLLLHWLNEVAEGRVQKLMVFQPPGSAKSTYVSQIFPPFYMARNPGHRVIGVSNTADLAKQFSRDVQGIISRHKHELGFDHIEDNPEKWNTTNGCRYLSAGVGGTIRMRYAP